MSSSVFVVGAGSFGTALALHLAHSEDRVFLWGNNSHHLDVMRSERSNQTYLANIAFPNNLEICKNFIDGFEARDILIAVPSHAFRDVIVKIKPYLTPSHRLLWGTKGFDPQTGGLLHHVVDTLLGETLYAILSGPSFAREVALGLPTATVIASQHKHYAEELVQRFTHHRFRAYQNDDIIGVQLGGALKNVLAIAVGISDGVGFGANARSALMTRGLAEMMRMGMALSAKRETLMGLAGVGDLILTCTDEQSRNRRFGLAMGRGEKKEAAMKQIGQLIEGIHTADQVYALSLRYAIDMPISTMVFHALQGAVTVREAANVLLSRGSKWEM